MACRGSFGWRRWRRQRRIVRRQRRRGNHRRRKHAMHRIHRIATGCKHRMVHVGHHRRRHVHRRRRIVIDKIRRLRWIRGGWGLAVVRERVGSGKLASARFERRARDNTMAEIAGSGAYLAK